MECKTYWLDIRRTLLREGVDRIGFGGYLHLVENHPDFIEYIKHLCSEFRMLRSLHENDIPYTPDLKVAILSARGKMRAWGCCGHYNRGNFSNPKLISQSDNGVRTVYTMDLDSDGDVDVISTSDVDGRIAWYENGYKDKKEVNFSPQKVITTEADGGIFANQKLITGKADGARLVYAADLDSDGDTDVLSASAADDTIKWNENDSTFNLTLLLVFNFLWSIVAGVIPVFMFAMFSDAADFHEWKFGRRATGLVIAGIMFSIKMGVAIGGFVNLQALGAFGYVANVPQTLETMQDIKLLFSLLPASIILICGVVLFFYPISEKQLATIESDLKERKSSEQETQ